MIHKIHGNLEDMKKAGENAATSLVDKIGISSKAIAGMAAAVATAAGVATFELAEHAEHFSDAIIRAGVAAHASREEIEELEHFAKNKAFDSLGRSAAGVAEALQELAREGFNVNESMTAVDATMKFMKISSLEARDAASLVHDTIAEFGMSANQSGELVDKLAFAMREFHFRAEELRPAIAGLASGAHLVNASFDDALIGVGILKDAFPNATKAAMAMNLALQQLASTNTQKELRGIGVSVRDATGHIRPLLDIIQDLSTRTSAYTDAQLAHKLATIGSARAAGGLAAIIDQLRTGTRDANGQVVTGAAALDVYRDKLSKTSGTADGLVSILGDTMGGAIGKLKNAISNLGTEIGLNFEGPWKRAIQTLNLFFRGITQLISQGGFSGEVKKELDKADNQGLKGFLIGIYVWGSRIRNAFDSLAASFSTAFAPFMPVMEALRESFFKLGHALGLAGQTAGENASAFDYFGEVGRTTGEIYAGLAGAVIPLLVASIKILTGTVFVLRAAWDAVEDSVLSFGQALKGTWNLIAGLMTNDWPTTWNGFVDVVIGAAKAVVNILLGIVRTVAWLGDVLNKAFGITSDMSGVMDGITQELNAKVDLGTTVLKIGSGPNPGVTAAQNVRAVAAGAAPAMSVAPEQNLTINTHVHLDGEKVGTAISKAKRSAEARSFTPVAAAEAGTF